MNTNDYTSAELAELLKILIAPRCGSGAYRDVYGAPFPWQWETPTGKHEDVPVVIKYQRPGKDFCNANEWTIWQDSPPRLRKWLAPCLEISSGGAWLIQARTIPIALSELQRHAKRIPQFFSDTKPKNWGWFRGRPVCHDYGNFNMWSRDMFKLVKANWLE